MTRTLRVHFDGVVLVPEQPVDLPIGKSVEVHITEPSSSSIELGTPAAVLAALHGPPYLSSETVPLPPTGNATVAAVFAAMRSTPPVSEEDVAELERMIEEGRQPIRYGGIFDEPGDD